MERQESGWRIVCTFDRMKTRIVLNGNNNNWRIGIGEAERWECYAGCDWNSLDEFLSKNAQRTCFITLSYELRHEIEGKTNDEPAAFPLIRLWVPESLFVSDGESVKLVEGTEDQNNRFSAEECLKSQPVPVQWNWLPVQDKSDYLQQVRFLQDQIQRGNIYEVNYCQQFCAENIAIQTILPVYAAMNEVSQTPFSFFYEASDWMIAGVSPERFLAKQGKRLISQPIKGTAPRGKNTSEDEQNKSLLSNSHKDKTENVMIVDLVRNDLSRVAKKNTVRVDELCGIYTFPTVHQMISTVSCELREEVRFSEIIRATFPMGSMTGAPKTAAMRLAEQTERFTRGIYSGSVGYIAPGGDFDLNVVIRSVVYDVEKKNLTCGVGGAITILSDAEAEYEECRTKVGKLLSTLGTCQW